MTGPVDENRSIRSSIDIGDPSTEALRVIGAAWTDTLLGRAAIRKHELAKASIAQVADVLDGAHSALAQTVDEAFEGVWPQ